MSENETENDGDGQDCAGVEQFGFDCPNCGATTVIETDNGPKSLKNKVFKCENCKGNIWISGYAEDLDE